MMVQSPIKLAGCSISYSKVVKDVSDIECVI